MLVHDLEETVDQLQERVVSPEAHTHYQSKTDEHDLGRGSVQGEPPFLESNRSCSAGWCLCEESQN